MLIYRIIYSQSTLLYSDPLPPNLMSFDFFFVDLFEYTKPIYSIQFTSSLSNPSIYPSIHLSSFIHLSLYPPIHLTIYPLSIYTIHLLV